MKPACEGKRCRTYYVRCHYSKPFSIKKNRELRFIFYPVTQFSFANLVESSGRHLTVSHMTVHVIIEHEHDVITARKF